MSLCSHEMRLFGLYQVRHDLSVSFHPETTPRCHRHQERKCCYKRVTLTHPLQQTLPLFHLGERNHWLYFVHLNPHLLFGVFYVEFSTFYCCCITDGGFNRVILSQLAFPFSVMVCQFFMDDHFREAFRRIFNAKSISIQWCIIVRTPLYMYPSVVTWAMSFICVEETLKLYCAVCRSWALSNW